MMFYALTILIEKSPHEFLKTFDIPTEEWRKLSGFITSLDRFVDRKEAWVIAKREKQIQFAEKASKDGMNSILISENLY